MEIRRIAYECGCAGWRFSVNDKEMNSTLAYDHQAEEVFTSFKLTPREGEVLFWISQGKSNREIGVILGAKTGTICKHVEHIFGKLNVENRTCAAMLALEACHTGGSVSENNAGRPWAAISGAIVMMVQELCPDACKICDSVSSLVA